jgi:DNA-binding winged helix-turn-helix (wHTH) protein
VVDLMAARTVRPGDDLDLTVVMEGQNGVDTSRRVQYRVPVGTPAGTLNFTIADATSTNVIEFQSAVATPQRSPQQVLGLLNGLRSNTKAYIRVWRAEPSFTVDGRAREIFKKGKKLEVQPQPTQVLVSLLENAGEVVTREELRQKIWPADTFVDFEHSLNTAIKKLRQALGDKAARPKYIETLPRRGYRFREKVEASGEKTGASVGASVARPGQLVHAAAPPQHAARPHRGGAGGNPRTCTTSSSRRWRNSAPQGASGTASCATASTPRMRAR